MLGTDLSQWGGALTRETAECWKRKGVEFAVVQYSERMRQHLEVLRDAGIRAEAYVYLYWGADPWGQTPQVRTRNALKGCGGFPVERLWLDAEDSTHPYDEGQLSDCADICVGAGMATGIYTGRWWWVPQTGDSRAFAHLPLWHAEYKLTTPQADPTFEVNFDDFKSYGGWTRPTIWQYQNTSSLCGHSVDMNRTESAAPVPEPPNAPNQPSKLQAYDALAEVLGKLKEEANLEGTPATKLAFEWIAQQVKGG